MCKALIKLEAGVGIEPASTALQAMAKRRAIKAVRQIVDPAKAPEPRAKRGFSGRVGTVFSQAAAGLLCSVLAGPAMAVDVPRSQVLERTELRVRAPAPGIGEVVSTLCRVPLYDIPAGTHLLALANVHVTNDALFRGRREDVGFSAGIWLWEAGVGTRINRLEAAAPAHTNGGPDVTTGAHHDIRPNWAIFTAPTHLAYAEVHYMGRAYSLHPGRPRKRGEPVRKPAQEVLRLDGCSVGVIPVGP